MQIDAETDRQKRLDQSLRQHHVTDSQRRKQHLIEASQKRDRSEFVESLKRRNRLSLKPKFTVVVILDDKRADFPRPRQDRQTPVERHRHSEWKLVCRSQIYGRGSVAQSFPNRDRKARLVGWNRDDLCAKISEGPQRTKVSGILHPH